MSSVEVNSPETANGRSANVLYADPLVWNDPLLSRFQSQVGSAADKGLQKALQSLIKIGVPIVARAMIGSMSYKLGNSQMPLDTTFVKSSGWAIALIIVLALVCVALVALVALCIWWERRLEQRSEKARRKAAEEWGNEEDGDEVIKGMDEVGPSEARSHFHSCSSRSGTYEDKSSAVSSFTSGSYSSDESVSNSDSNEELG